MRKYFSTGLIILLPFALTVWIVHYLFDLFTNPLFKILEKITLWFERTQGLSQLQHETLVTFLSRIVALILTFFFIVALGYLARKFFFNAMLKFTHETIYRIPVVGAIYRLTKDLTKAMLSTDQKTFKETILVPFPSSETYSVGFITSDVPEDDFWPGFRVARVVTVTTGRRSPMVRECSPMCGRTFKHQHGRCRLRFSESLILQTFQLS